MSNPVDAVARIVIDSARELSRDGILPGDLVLAADSVLFGDGGVLDSIGLTTLIVVVEGKVSDEFERVVTIADDRAFSLRASPFATVRSLAEYVAGLLS